MKENMILIVVFVISCIIFLCFWACGFIGDSICVNTIVKKVIIMSIITVSLLLCVLAVLCLMF